MIHGNETPSRTEGDAGLGVGAFPADPSGPIPPLLRKPHSWAQAFSVLCRTLESRKADLAALNDIGKASGPVMAGGDAA